MTRPPNCFNLIKAFIPVIISMLFFCSCATTYKPAYFMDVPNSVDTVITIVAPNNVPKIKYGDILSISVIPIDQLSNLYQTPVAAGGVAYSSQTSELAPPPSGSGFTVDKNGTIEAPLIGKVKLSDL